MFEKSTPGARRAVVLGQEESRLLNHDYIGTEHLLLGLIAQDECVAARVLEALGIPLVAVRTQVEEVAGRGNSGPRGRVPFTPGAKNAMELASSEARQLDDDYIGTEHLLLGLISEGEGIAAQVLASLGAHHSSVRAKVIETPRDEPEEWLLAEATFNRQKTRRWPWSK